MSNLEPVELKAYVPARDFYLSKRFYMKEFAESLILNLLS